MLVRRIDFRSAIDGLLLAVPPILMVVVIPERALDIALRWIFDHPGAEIGGIDAISLMNFGILFWALIAGFAATRWLAPRLDRWVPLRLTPARLLLTLLLTLLALALTAVDIVYGA